LNVSRETVEALAARLGLSGTAAGQLAALIEALGREPDPHSTVADPVAEHLADSLSGLEVDALRGADRIADVGAGAGFPGLPLAVALPGARVELVESARRKAELIERLARAAGLSNARVVRARAEEWAVPGAEGREAYDAVTARAVAPLAVLVEYAAPLLHGGGALVAWKGARDEAEEEGGARAAAAVGMAPREVLRVTPFAGARRRHLHVFEKVAATPPGIPRRPGAARKRPLR
jgi:16S rRNA (guanine527-N7)-methyltransferase